MQVLLNLSLILLPLQLCHLLAVLVLLTREIVLHLLVVFRRIFDVGGQLLFLLFEFIVLMRLVNLLLDISLESCKYEICLHLFDYSKGCLEQVILVLAHLLLI